MHPESFPSYNQMRFLHSEGGVHLLYCVIGDPKLCVQEIRVSVASQCLLIRQNASSNWVTWYETINGTAWTNQSDSVSEQHMYALRAANRSAYRNVLRAASFTFAGNISVIFVMN